jgi:hypothetical protein
MAKYYGLPETSWFGRARGLSARTSVKNLLADKWWLVFPLYLLGGLILGLADPTLCQGMQQLGVRPGLATAVSVNLVLPVLAIGLSMICPRVSTAWLGAIAMTGAFILGLAFVYMQPPQRDAVAILRAVPPVLIVAGLGYAVLGTLTALVTRAVWKSPP